MIPMKRSCAVVFFTLMAFLFSFRSVAETGKPAREIMFNFIEVEIPTVIKFISEITGKNFIYDENVKGKVTILTPEKLSVDESFSLFTSVLELKGYTVVPSGAKAYKVIPSVLAKQAGSIFSAGEGAIDEAYITRLIPAKHIKVDDALKFLQPMVSRNGHISAFNPGNQLLVVDSALNIDKIAAILSSIDQPPTHEEPPRVYVYPLENADAKDLSTVLEGIVKSAAASKQQKGAVPPSSVPFDDITVTPDRASNSLIIVATPDKYEPLTGVIRELDKRRRQVFVEAMIIEASIDRVKDLGTKWRGAARNNGEPVVIGGFGSMDAGSVLDILTGLTGLTAGGMGNFLDVPVTTIGPDGSFKTTTLTVPGFAALFDLSDFRDAINVLSTPQILTSDNEEAEIVVGENVPFVSQSQRDLAATNAVLSSVVRQDVGIKLNITPQITEGDYVKLDIYQEISSVKEESENITISVGPTTTKRATKTSIVVRDNQTVVISGLMEEKDEERTEKTPFLGDIPVFGWLFKHNSRTKTKTNLLIFITPHIVKDSVQLAGITEKKHREFSEKEQYYYAGELMVKFREDITGEKALDIISGNGASVIKYLETSGTYQIRLRPEQEVEEAIKEFSLLPEVLYAEPNFKVKIQNEIPAGKE